MRLLISGAGVSGSAAAALATQNGYAVTIYDDSPATAAETAGPGVEAVSGGWTFDLVHGMDLVVVSPGVPQGAAPIRDAVEAGVELWSEVEFAFRHTDVPITAVTGTNGKTTVTELIVDMLRRAGRKAVAAGNIGTPLSSVSADPWDDIVAEVSSFQLRFVSEFHPRLAVVLGVTADHLDWHGSVSAYHSAKGRIVENQTEADVVVFDADNLVASEIAARSPARGIPISGSRLPEGGSGVTDGVVRVGPVHVEVSSLAISDAAYLSDLVAAGAAALDLGASVEVIQEALRDFRPGEHRRQPVGSWNGVLWVDDSKATNPDAALASIEAYPSVVLIAGGRNKGLDLASLVRHPHLRGIVAIGEAADELTRASKGRSLPASDMSEAVQVARSIAARGDTVLLAPACASFDMFAGYAERGDAFQSAVMQEISRWRQ